MRNLILVNDPGRQALADIEAIRDEIARLDPSVAVHIAFNSLDNNREKTRREIAGLVLSISLALAGAGLARAQELTPLKVAIGGPGVTGLPLWMAETSGLYEKHGLDVELVDVESGSRALQVLLSGGVDLANVGVSAVVPANKEGADLRLVSATSNTMLQIIFSRPEIKTADDLKGKTVVISSYGSESDIAVSLALQEIGLAREDVTVVQLGGASQRIAALLSGSADASPLSGSVASKAVAEGLNPLVDLSAAGVPWVFDAMAARAESLKENRDALKRFLKAHVEAAYKALAEPEPAKAVLTEVFKVEPADAGAGYDLFAQVMPDFAEPNRKAIENALKVLPSVGVEVGSAQVDDYVDTSLIQELRSEGFFDEMSKLYPRSK